MAWIEREGYNNSRLSDRQMDATTVRALGLRAGALFAPHLPHIRVPQFVIENLKLAIKRREEASAYYHKLAEDTTDSVFKLALQRENQGHAFYQLTERRIVAHLEENNSCPQQAQQAKQAQLSGGSSLRTLQHFTQS